MIRAGDRLKPAGANSRRSSSASSISAGTGQVIPITAVRRRYSATVVCPTPTERAIVRTLAPHAYFSRRTSRTLRIDNLSAGIATPFMEGHATGHRIADFDPTTPFKAVRDRLESLSALRRNQCPPCIGTTARLRSESARYQELRPHWRRVRTLFSGLLQRTELASTPTGQPVIAALDYLRGVKD